ncbi:MAG TPA: hypothetical protein VNM67_14270, partial [Thermoanaerobaculia bacterium]|nr:hypothetical protein [Thermoanaerobaculia bacterium]
AISFSDFLDNFGPLNGADYAKTLVWCFIAGFSERFIPDVLDSFVRKERERAPRDQAQSSVDEDHED